MRSQRNFDSDKNAFYCTAYSSLEYSSLNLSTFEVIEDFFFCFWSELNIIFDWRQRVWLFTRRELFIVSAERQTKQNPELWHYVFIATHCENIWLNWKLDLSSSYLLIHQQDQNKSDVSFMSNFTMANSLTESYFNHFSYPVNGMRAIIFTSEA